ncbi:methyltransferase domain-containing protein [Streptomyces sp. NPDC016566]|uniref:methyltransferase domain-containing protein n=1 Tax=unclassified Streptomyces TaxID=2593676 RepID=UPI0011AA5DA2|nr:methyltransferase domain-containing protein [Streptomyces sp. BK340]TVZ80471.1 release factor glutamine methyltransferase [Streptomyces sp. BK340]
MSGTQSFVRSLERSRLSLTRPDRPAEFELLGLRWNLLDEVFAPVFSPSTAVALDLLGLAEAGPGDRSGSFLEIGCGTGVAAVRSALAGCERVVAADVNPRAVENAALNAVRHGVGDRVRAVRSDLFSALQQERFDMVFWSSNYVRAPEDYTYRSMHERAYVDPGYRTHRRYLAEAPRMLAPGGRALLHFSSRGVRGELYEMARELGRELHVVRSVELVEQEYGADAVEHLLLEIRVADSGDGRDRPGRMSG